MIPQTIAGAREYWDQYYGAEFIFGLGTERILAILQQVPPAGTWADLGAGSESLLWSIPLDARHLIAIDHDEQRLQILRAFAACGQPRGAYQTALNLCGRNQNDFAARRQSLTATLAADCFAGAAIPLRRGSVDLVTQFGLLGLATSPAHFASAWTACHEPLASGGWVAGANWSATRQPGRIRLDRQLYQAALTGSGMTALLIEQVPIAADPDFDSVWIYLGRKQ